jgi:hypothetical protein
MTDCGGPGCRAISEGMSGTEQIVVWAGWSNVSQSIAALTNEIQSPHRADTAAESDWVDKEPGGAGRASGRREAAHGPARA